jgi:hypothetical protein
MSSLLRSQLEHLQRAEFRLPANRQTNIYINALETEGEAADYIRKVTTAIHEEHAKHVLKKFSAKRVPQIAAMAEAPKTKSRHLAGTKSADRKKRAREKTKRRK